MFSTRLYLDQKVQPQLKRRTNEVVVNYWRSRKSAWSLMRQWLHLRSTVHICWYAYELVQTFLNTIITRRQIQVHKRVVNKYAASVQCGTASYIHIRVWVILECCTFSGCKQPTNSIYGPRCSRRGLPLTLNIARSIEHTLRGDVNVCNSKVNMDKTVSSCDQKRSPRKALPRFRWEAIAFVASDDRSSASFHTQLHHTLSLIPYKTQ